MYFFSCVKIYLPLYSLWWLVRTHALLSSSPWYRLQPKLAAMYQSIMYSNVQAAQPPLPATDPSLEAHSRVVQNACVSSRIESQRQRLLPQAMPVHLEYSTGRYVSSSRRLLTFGPKARKSMSCRHR